MDLLNDWENGSYLRKFNHDNRTIDTICQLTGIELGQLILSSERAKNAFSMTPYVQTLIPNMVDYFRPRAIFSRIVGSLVGASRTTVPRPIFLSRNGVLPPSLCGPELAGAMAWKPPTTASSNLVRQSSAATGIVPSATLTMRTTAVNLIIPPTLILTMVKVSLH